MHFLVLGLWKMKKHVSAGVVGSVQNKLTGFTRVRLVGFSIGLRRAALHLMRNTTLLARSLHPRYQQKDASGIVR